MISLAGIPSRFYIADMIAILNNVRKSLSHATDATSITAVEISKTLMLRHIWTFFLSYAFHW